VSVYIQGVPLGTWAVPTANWCGTLNGHFHTKPQPDRNSLSFVYIHQQMRSGCAMSPGLPDFTRLNIPKRGKNIPNYHRILNSHKICPNGRKTFQMTRIYNSIFVARSSKIYPKWDCFGLKRNHLATLDVARNKSEATLSACRLSCDIVQCKNTFVIIRLKATFLRRVTGWDNKKSPNLQNNPFL
jgi:hypothetical protein